MPRDENAKPAKRGGERRRATIAEVYESKVPPYKELKRKKLLSNVETLEGIAQEGNALYSAFKLGKVDHKEYNYVMGGLRMQADILAKIGGTSENITVKFVGIPDGEVEVKSDTILDNESEGEVTGNGNGSGNGDGSNL